jgi:cellulose biosynthesis protein BcsQ
MKTIAFFSNRGGVGQTKLVYHLAWMFADMGLNVVAVDLDPQSNLTDMFLEEDRLVELWPVGTHPLTIQGAVEPILRGTGDIQAPHVEAITDRIGLVVGAFGLVDFEEKLSEAWSKFNGDDESAFHIVTAFSRLFRFAAERREADLVLVDTGPNLASVNQSALIASQNVVISVAADLFSLEGLRHLGPKLEAWRELRKSSPTPDLSLPPAPMRPVGYVVMHRAPRSHRPVKEYLHWMHSIPGKYRESILREPGADYLSLEDDPYCLAAPTHYRSLAQMATEARKPMFFLKPADGAIGAHGEAVRDCYRDFKALAERILTAVEFRPTSDPA